jgi:hypothetical protein
MRDKARCADLHGGTPTEFELLPGFLGFARPKSGHFFSKVHQNSCRDPRRNSLEGAGQSSIIKILRHLSYHRQLRGDIE